MTNILIYTFILYFVFKSVCCLLKMKFAIKLYGSSSFMQIKFPVAFDYIKRFCHMMDQIYTALLTCFQASLHDIIVNWLTPSSDISLTITIKLWWSLLVIISVHLWSGQSHCWLIKGMFPTPVLEFSVCLTLLLMFVMHMYIYTYIYETIYIHICVYAYTHPYIWCAVKILTFLSWHNLLWIITENARKNLENL